jgi:hypothetical protein
MERGMMIENYVEDFFVHKRCLSAFKIIEFVHDRMWYNKIHDVKESFYEELCVFCKFPNTI